ncbi:two-component system response regulator [Devosia pacifica]|uniref:Two-component system response regulator n=1 Tax=Devosia pacifica TaxID=1335967 RepID=A0A918S086_9HYPH|nr:HD domain-containing phosphohydrolase [Devosia pacifica]GHA18302.1 two-component system response regulator [Devosia pacifica]
MRIVVVEDNPTNLAVFCGIVGRMPGVSVEGFTTGAAALADAERNACDIVVVDNVMPGMTGIELLALLRAMPSHAHVPVVVITSDADREVRLAAIKAGATDFLAKPVDPIELRLRITNLLALRQAQQASMRRSVELACEVEEATASIRQREEEIIRRLARAFEFHDNETSGHVDRVACVAEIIAEGLKLPVDYVRTLRLAVPLHDIGKIGVPDAILRKSGPLDEEEQHVMRRHVDIGQQILADGDSDLVRMAADIASFHHEKWDGTGYPGRLAGENIPLSARITAVADVFDALCSVRSYKSGWSLQEARAEIVRQSGRHFDPACVASFEAGWQRISETVSPSFCESAA